MTPEQIKKIDFFSQTEIEKTGACLADVKVELMQAISYVRRKINRRIKPLYNGMTTGKHSAQEHPNGQAIDYTLDERDGPITQETLQAIERHGIDAGFRGFGWYYNGNVWSFHNDLRSNFTAWTGRKSKPGESWVYKRMSIGHPAK